MKFFRRQLFCFTMVYYLIVTAEKTFLIKNILSVNTLPNFRKWIGYEERVQLEDDGNLFISSLMDNTSLVSSPSFPLFCINYFGPILNSFQSWMKWHISNALELIKNNRFIHKAHLPLNYSTFCPLIKVSFRK